MWTATVFCWMTVKSIAVSSASAGTESTATISKMRSFPPTMHYTQKLCVRQAESNAKSVKHTLYQRQKTSGTARIALLSKSGRKLPCASAGNGRRSCSQVSGRSPDELLICGYKQSARSDRAEIEERNILLIKTSRKTVSMSRFLEPQIRRNQGFFRVKMQDEIP